MLQNIIAASLRHKILVLAGTLLLIIWGIWSAIRLPIDAVPDITNNQVQVITVAPSQSAPDIERLVTFPVEQTMATIPGLIEMRSFSRFGLSVITLVFRDDIDIYWARQQAGERLALARQEIPPGAGTPELAPVTTGLGEIFQYYLRVKPGYEQQYSLAELRSIQDWVVRRQLLGVPGVADVASFGGNLRQYEIAVNPKLLTSFGLSLQDLFTALEQNNQNTGGAYIEKGPNAFFIRSEGLLGTKADIGEVRVGTSSQGLPILMRDVAAIGDGTAVKYGAMVLNDAGEVAGAVTLMLKGENSNAVIGKVKERIAQIEKNLPAGIRIDGFLDRSKLVNRAINTVQTNLIEGALIVIFVLVLFLGNLRAGLVVASVIPMALLFALGMMQVFGVSGNLMSLGAIDFGLIVDGAVIIVEATMHHLRQVGNRCKLTQQQMDSEVLESASVMQRSAAFGQIIILIVYLPVMALAGVEGKIFRPMAQTVSFALLGAFLLSLTYVPVVAALMLPKLQSSRSNLSERVMHRLAARYRRSLEKLIFYRKTVIGAAFALLLLSVWTFSRMGAEFLPTLEEGDFAVDTRVLTGSSLQQTIQATKDGAGLLMAAFPDEVEQVVSKIGSSEIPVDPMPIEAADMMVILKPVNQWKKAKSREVLAEKMAGVLAEIPGVTFGFQQPIQMRFNELMTGARQDVAVKIYGDDLDTLALLAEQVGMLAGSVEGARDVYVESATGLSQIVVRMNRDAMARFGVDAAALNSTLQAAFAGFRAGTVYEGERRYDLVVRLDTANRVDVNDVAQLMVPTSSNTLVPLSQVASVNLEAGPNQIQRDNARRRIIVGFNVRGRDVQSVVENLQQKMDASIRFPEAYFASFDGQFEQLQQALSRLSIAVPLALLLIFILLYLAFNSLSDALMVLSAIPLAAVGGVFSLQLRSMPFSISAAIGFIALFGVAVLNGIVLIAAYQRLRQQGVPLLQAVLEGSASRLRPVLMTAAVASLGFLPMAVSVSAGAEVQKPLATVVMGGLFSACLLTLFVLPCLYVMVRQWAVVKKPPKQVLAALLVAGCLLSQVHQAHSQTIWSKTALVDTANRHSSLLQASQLELAYFRQLEHAIGFAGKTELTMMLGQYNSYEWGDNYLGLQQPIPNPALRKAQRQLAEANTAEAGYRLQLTNLQWNQKVEMAYYALQYFRLRHALLQRFDSLALQVQSMAALRVASGDAAPREQIAAEVYRKETVSLMLQNQTDLQAADAMVRLLAGLDGEDSIAAESLDMPGEFNKTEWPSADHPHLQLASAAITTARSEQGLIGAGLQPDFRVGAFSQTLIGNVKQSGSSQLATVGNRFWGLQAGVSVAIFTRPERRRMEAGAVRVKAMEANLQAVKHAWEQQWLLTMAETKKAGEAARYQAEVVLPRQRELHRQLMMAYGAGDAGYFELMQSMRVTLEAEDRQLLFVWRHQMQRIALNFFYNNATINPIP